uniref:Uncharacterized protein n=1 Tax=Oryza sativa subsp. japonica TaxID=39947 RepID=Q851K8_ORYSJ|nr:hypothetical protein [Oryza sativa Japonica Group]
MTKRTDAHRRARMRRKQQDARALLLKDGDRRTRQAGDGGGLASADGSRRNRVRRRRSSKRAKGFGVRANVEGTVSHHAPLPLPTTPHPSLATLEAWIEMGRGRT